MEKVVVVVIVVKVKLAVRLKKTGEFVDVGRKSSKVSDLYLGV